MGDGGRARAGEPIPPPAGPAPFVNDHLVIDVALSLEELGWVRLAGASAVVIDVVRASTTIVAALAHGARGLVPVATPEEASARARGWVDGEVLLGGERGGAPPPGFDLGNSPAEYANPRVRGRTIVFTTTNGTRALLAVREARRVAVAGFVNAGAVVRWLGREPGAVLLVCAGEDGRFCLEDAACAGLLVARLVAAHPGAGLSDSARAATAIFAPYRGDLDRLLADAAWARALATQGRGADLPLCIATDVHALVPVIQDGILVQAAFD